MKIAIVTLPLHTNYGGILQAYALQTVLEKMGHTVEHLQPYSITKHPIWKLPFVWCKRIFKRFIVGEKGLPIFMHPQKWIRKHTDAFISKNINCRFIESGHWNETLALSYDMIVFGSDQIWRSSYVPYIERYFGSFLFNTNVSRITYAASFGTDENEFTLEQQKEFASLLKEFRAVSVREDIAVDMCKTLFGVDAVQVLDPTFLLSKDDYIKLFHESNCLNNKKGNLAVYILDETPSITDFIQRVSAQNKLVPFRTNSKVEDYDAPIVERQQPPLEQWLSSFYDAELVITDSFHACVFSIIFHKPFICVGNKSRGSARFNSLLSMLELEDRMVDIEDANKFKLRPICWNNVEQVLKQKKHEAYNYINNALN